jgi:hypothetical protein
MQRSKFSRLGDLIDEYQSGKLVKDLKKAGGPDGFKVPAEDKTLQLQEILTIRLKDFWKFNDRMFVIILIVLIAFVIFLGFLVWLYHNQSTVVIGLLTGESGGLYFGINKMHRLNKESMAYRMFYELLLAATTTEERNKIIESINGILK